ncbi:MAG: quinone-dependent dihydroorotate dehydrogenase [Candidatus Gracilibacteria bacterium]
MQVKEFLIKVRNSISRFFYKNIFKRIVFHIDPERTHDGMTRIGRILGSNFITRGLTSFAFNYSHPALEQTILGINFQNPLGLSAGFDKDAHLTNILPNVGFGFEEIGSITGEPCEGNPKPRLWRLKKSQALVVYYGLKNDGALSISTRLKGETFRFPIGISIAKTNCRETVDTNAGIADYFKAYVAFQDIGDYYTINISCPNAFGGEPFTDKEKLEFLLTKIDTFPSKKPIFLKISPDLTESQLDDIIAVSQNHHISGFVCTNLNKDRSKIAHKILDKDLPSLGGISGKVVEDLSNKFISEVYKKTHGKMIVIGVGGIFSAADAYKKIRLGASLLQLITGMIFEGPQVISEINQGLVELLKKDGYNNISEAIGADHKK